DLVETLVVGCVFADRKPQIHSVVQRVPASVQRVRKSAEGARYPTTVDRHDEPDRIPLVGLGPVVDVRDVILDLTVDAPLVRAHLDESIVDLAVRDGRRYTPGFVIGPQQVARMT